MQIPVEWITSHIWNCVSKQWPVRWHEFIWFLYEQLFIWIHLMDTFLWVIWSNQWTMCKYFTASVIQFRSECCLFAWNHSRGDNVRPWNWPAVKISRSCWLNEWSLQSIDTASHENAKRPNKHIYWSYCRSSCQKKIQHNFIYFPKTFSNDFPYEALPWFTKISSKYNFIRTRS